ncbi:MAG: hypothetical protein AAF443_00585 [Chlamydiota bacterium]
MTPILRWHSLKEVHGVITGCDDHQEWLLKWWWSHYRKCNTFPVTFLDFGMSTSARKWCQKKGTVISIELPLSIIGTKKSFSKEVQQNWETLYASTVWKARKGWLSKPIGLMHTPYQRTVWTDLDCQILQPLDPLFDASLSASGVAAVPEVKRAVAHAKRCGILLPGEKAYNTGVLAYCHQSTLITKWAKNTYTRSYEFMGDGEVFGRTIFEEKFQPTELTRKFNRYFRDGVTPETVIVHFVCSGGKHVILKTMQLEK